MTYSPDALITGESPLSQINEAFDSLATQPDHMKVLIGASFTHP